MPFQQQGEEQSFDVWTSAQEKLLKDDADVALREDNEYPRKYRDPKLTVLFFLNAVVSIGFGVYCSMNCDWHKLQIDDDESQTPSPTWDPEEIDSFLYEGTGLAIGAIAVSVILSYASLYATAKYTKCLLYTGGVLQMLMFFVFFMLSQSLIFLVFGGIILFFYGLLLCKKDAIDFAIWVVQTSCQVLKDHRGVIRLALFWCLFQSVICCCYFLMAFGGFAMYGVLAFIYLLFSTYWTAEVLSNIMVVTVSTLAASWCTGDQPIANPVSFSFRYSSTYALGSICLGSLIVSILKTIRLVARILASSGGNNGIGRLLALCCMCVVQCIENLVRYFNEWAYAYIGMYHKDFSTSASMVWDLLQTDGCEAIANDIYTDMVVQIPPLITGLVVAGLSALVAHYCLKWDGEMTVIATIFCGLLGLILCSLVMRLVATGQNVIFLSYLENRDRFYRKHQYIVGSLEEKFRARYGVIVLRGQL
jgi:hypothetical protein